MKSWWHWDCDDRRPDTELPIRPDLGHPQRNQYRNPETRKPAKKAGFTVEMVAMP